MNKQINLLLILYFITSGIAFGQSIMTKRQQEVNYLLKSYAEWYPIRCAGLLPTSGIIA